MFNNTNKTQNSSVGTKRTSNRTANVARPRTTEKTSENSSHSSSHRSHSNRTHTQRRSSSNGKPSHNNSGSAFRNRNQKRDAFSPNRRRTHSNQSRSRSAHAGATPSLVSQTRRKVMRRPRSNNTGHKAPQAPVEIPPIGDNIRIIPLGGVEEVGKNMTAIEIGNDIIVVDAGFQFKNERTPGIDYILPNYKYLEERKDRVKGLFITHGHLDHIGAVPYVLPRIGNPPIYSREFGAIMIKKRQEEFPQSPEIDMRVLDGDETITINENMKIETFAISHTIPDSMGLIIHTHLGDIVFIEDVRVDNVQGVPTEEEVGQYKRFKNKDILLLTMDSTGIEKPGWSLSENVVVENMEKIIKDVGGRLIIGTFASQVERILAIIHMADKYGKKVVFEGRSMKNNLEIMKHLKLLKTNNIIPLSEAENYPPDRIIMLVTGSQGEEFAVLSRIVDKNHKYIKFRPTDTILLSSSIIPTNHNQIVRLKNKLYRCEAKVITYLDSDIHASGHGSREELTWIHNQFNYKYFMPVHGEHFMVRQHAELSQSLGTPETNTVIPDNGSIVEISDGGNKIEKLPVKAPHEIITVDGFGVSPIQEVVLNDRTMLSEAGIFVIVASINTKTGRLKKSPDIISRGFVYLRESQDLLQNARDLIKKTIERNVQNKRQVDFEELKKIVADDVSRYLFQQTAKEPLVIPVILGV